MIFATFFCLYTVLFACLTRNDGFDLIPALCPDLLVASYPPPPTAGHLASPAQPYSIFRSIYYVIKIAIAQAVVVRFLKFEHKNDRLFIAVLNI